jgi:hypothetical protein
MTDEKKDKDEKRERPGHLPADRPDRPDRPEPPTPTHPITDPPPTEGEPKPVD